MQSNVTLSGVTFEFENGRILFQNLSFTLGPGVTALVGANGVGKTTLGKLISGELSPSKGIIKTQGNVLILKQNENPEDIPVYEYIAENYSWSLWRERLLDGIDQERKCSELSGGQWMRVRLANMLSESFIIMDEPTNNLDREGRDIILDFLRSYQFGVLLISHDRECLNLCTDVLELSSHGVSKYGGPWEKYEDEKKQERDRLRKNLETAKKERADAIVQKSVLIGRQEKRNQAGRKKASRGGAPKILLGRNKQKAEGTLGRVESENIDAINSKIREAHEAFQSLKVDQVMYAGQLGTEIPSQKLVAEGKQFNIFFTKWIYDREIRFSWRGNIRLAIKGKNGSGKSSLLRAIMGENFLIKGEITRGNLRTIYLDQRCSSLDFEKSIFENVRGVSNLPDNEIRSRLAGFLFFGESVFQTVDTLSGGERLRAALAQGFLKEEEAELLIMDEPTNNLDMPNIEFLERLIREFKGAVILISHDDVFLEKCGINETFEI